MARFERNMGPDLTVALDESLCIVLRTPERSITVGDVDGLKDALDTARTFQRIYDDDAWQRQAEALREHQRQNPA